MTEEVERIVKQQEETDKLLCSCGHPYGDHAGHGGGCLFCNGHCQKFELKEDKPST